MVNKLLSENILIGGYDSGNTKDKISYLNEKGNIRSFEIPKVIAPAPKTKLKVEGPKKNENQVSEDIDLLHVQVQSKSLDHKDNGETWYVGSYAKDKKGKRETEIKADGTAEEKFNLQNKALHIIPLITGIAVAAKRSGKSDVVVPYSGGMPIEDYKNRGGDYISELLIGGHEIKFIDGIYEGSTVKINISSATINIEGVHSTLALEFDIVDGEIVEIENRKLPENYLLNDLGAGTTDNAVFINSILNKESSTNSFIGTNKYIDLIIRDIKEELLKRIAENKKYAAFRNFFENMEAPIKTREEFIKSYLEPEIDKMLENDKYEPTFIVKWGPVKDEDVTDIVMKHLKDYADEQIKDLMEKWIDTNVDKMINVGGGLLFGYPFFKDLKKNEDIIFPANIKESPYFTSRSYLISNYLEQLDQFATKA